MKTTIGNNGGLQFDDQLKQISSWFDDWNDCDQTVALHSLLLRLAPQQARFLTQCIQQFHADSFELPLLENRANSAEYLESLHGLNPDTAACVLLQHLPLLRPGNDQIRTHYLALIQDVLFYALRSGTVNIECRQILLYSLMHPAFGVDDKKILKRWMQRLDNLTTFGQVTTSLASTADNDIAFGMSNDVHDHQQRQIVNQHQHQTNPVSRLDSWTNGCSANEAPHSPPNLVSVPTTKDSKFGAFNSSVGMRSASIGGSADFRGSVTGSYSDANCINQLAVRLNNTVSFFSPTTHPLKSDAATVMMAPSNGFLNGRSRRSNSLTPPSTSSSSSSLSSGIGGSNGVVCCQLGPEEIDHVKPRSMSLSSTSGLLSPQISLASSGSGSEGHLDGSFSFDNVGMKNIPIWLKKLRLHKYTYLFSGLKYEDIFEMTDETLAARGVTKGARTKIIINIQKLRDRQETLRSLEKNLTDGGSPLAALNGLDVIVVTPLIAFQTTGSSDSGKRKESDGNDVIAEGDLPGQITRLFSNIFVPLLHRQLEDNNLHMFMNLIEKCLSNEAFDESQKKRLSGWYHRVRELCYSQAPRRGSDYRHNRGRLNRNYVDCCQYSKFGSSSNPVAAGPSSHNALAQQHRFSSHLTSKTPSIDAGDFQLENYHQQQQQQRRSSPAVLENSDLSRSSLSLQMAAVTLTLANRQQPTQGIFTKRGSLQENNSHSLLMRTRSVPTVPAVLNQYHLFGNGKSGINNMDNEFIYGLESVSRSVTEHALGDSG